MKNFHFLICKASLPDKIQTKTFEKLFEFFTYHLNLSLKYNSFNFFEEIDRE